MRRKLSTDEVRDWFANASEEALREFLEDGLGDLIEAMEGEDYFGTEGFGKRFS